MFFPAVKMFTMEKQYYSYGNDKETIVPRKQSGLRLATVIQMYMVIFYREEKKKTEVHEA